MTGLPGNVVGLPGGAIASLLLGVVSAGILPRLWRTGPTVKMWLLAGFIAFSAGLWFQLRLPSPPASDISQQIPKAGTEVAQSFRVSGQVDSSSRLTRSGQVQFDMTAVQVTGLSDKGAVVLPPRPVSGKAYVTIAKSQVQEKLFPGQRITVEGMLYEPKAAKNPGAFDFRKYLAQKEIFAGLRAQTLNLATQQPAPPLLWLIQQHIVNTQVKGLGTAKGNLLSAMVMGRGSVDVPYSIQDQFKQVGLSHALAASGFQVSLVVTVIVVVTQGLQSGV